VPPESIHEKSTYNICQREPLQRGSCYGRCKPANELRKEPKDLDRSHGFIEGVGFALVLYSCDGEFLTFDPSLLDEPDNIGIGQHRLGGIWCCRHPELDTSHQYEVTERMRPFALVLTDSISYSASMPIPKNDLQHATLMQQRKVRTSKIVVMVLLSLWAYNHSPTAIATKSSGAMIAVTNQMIL
jgi:hypothetical protein